MQILKQITSRYLVVAQSEGKTTQHYAKDWDAALDVMARYQAGAACAVYSMFLGVAAVQPVASRFA